MSLWLPAKELTISNANPDHTSNEFVAWIPIMEDGERFLVAEILRDYYLDIWVEAKPQDLSAGTSYSAYLVFKLRETTSDIDDAKASVRFVREMPAGTEGEGYTVFIAKKNDGSPGIYPQTRADGWLEVYLGVFFLRHGETSPVRISLHKIDDLNNVKAGLIVKGIEVRPNV